MSPTEPMRRLALLCPVAALVAVAQPGVAYADDSSGAVAAGYLHSQRWIADQAGNGVEATYVYYPVTMPHDCWGYGGFVHVESVIPHPHPSFSVGPQINCAVGGFELGYDYLGSDGIHAAAHGLYLGPFLSISILSIGWHAVIPIGWSGSGKAPEFEHVLTVSVKFPLYWHGDMYDLRIPSGRPVHTGDGTMVADLRRGDGWTPATARVPAPDASIELADWLAERWRRSAQEEHASVAAFARLALALLAVGAPASLVEGVQSALRDEIAHAHLCFSLAGDYAGEIHEPGPFPAALAPLHTPTLAELAVETLRDGCLGEGTAAALYARSAATACDANLKTVLQRIAADERRHAELGWRIVEWCLRTGGVMVAAALEVGAPALPKALKLVALPDVPAEEAAAHGQLAPFEQMQTFLEVKRSVLYRLATLGAAASHAVGESG